MGFGGGFMRLLLGLTGMVVAVIAGLRGGEESSELSLGTSFFGRLPLAFLR